jgi:hypothetical protein
MGRGVAPAGPLGVHWPGGPASFQTRSLLLLWERYARTIRTATGRQSSLVLLVTGRPVLLKAHPPTAAAADRINWGRRRERRTGTMG